MKKENVGANIKKHRTEKLIEITRRKGIMFIGNKNTTYEMENTQQGTKKPPNSKFVNKNAHIGEHFILHYYY